MRRTLHPAPLFFLLLAACGPGPAPSSPTCGDGFEDTDELCDDGNTEDGDGCSAECELEWPSAACGNGVLDPLESCDDGNKANGDGCSADCKLESCGNGVVDPGEDCDDGNDVNLDGCPNDCTKGKCGDGVVEAPYEVCEPPNTSVCDAACQPLAVCGDGEVAGMEQCDDGNASGGDGCNATCQLEKCGDGVVNNSGKEACDDGNKTNGDGCSSACQSEFCGDGVLQAGLGEACDDGNVTAGDGCRYDCTVEACGDGVLDPSETCDDGNAIDDDGCGNDCKANGCYDGETNPAERCYQSFTSFPGPDGVDIRGKGDIDGDGREDVFVWTYGDQIGWYRNQGDGRLIMTPIATISLNHLPQIGDVDADGDLDVVAKEYNGGGLLDIWKNDGKGKFAQSVSNDTSDYFDFILADLDVDGDADMVLMFQGWTGIAVRENLGGGKFGPAQTITTNSEVNVAAGDLDGDGDPEIVSYAGEPEALRVYENQGGFTFAPPVEVPISPTNSGFGAPVVLADVDGNGLRDAITTDPVDGEVVIALNQGGYVFSVQQVPVGNGQVNVPLVMDADGDGDQDIFLSLDVQMSDPQGISVLENDGAGQFALGADLWTLGFASSMVSLDLEQDGDLDVVSADFDGLDVLVNSPAGLLPRQITIAAAKGSEVLLADVDGDGDDDAVVEGDGVWVAQNDGAGLLSPPVLVPGTEQAKKAALGDLNGDGAADLVVGFDFLKKTVDVRFNVGGGGFSAPVVIPNIVDEPQRLLIGDVDGDGDQDLVVCAFYEAQVLLNDGAGSFAPQPSFSVSGVNFVKSAVLADRTGDGMPDLFLVLESRIDTLENKGGGSFVKLSSVPLDFEVGYAAFGDLDADGEVDVLVAPSVYTDLTEMRLYHGLPGAMLSAPTLLPADKGMASPVFVDLNLDGKLDLASVSPYNGKLMLYYQGAAGQLALEATLEELYGGRSLVAGRINADTLPDLLVAGEYDRRMMSVLSAP